MTRWRGALGVTLALAGLVGQGGASAQTPAEMRQRASAGDVAAQNDLGLMYYNGEGVPQDYVEAVRWYRLAAEQGFAAAQLNLGVMYDRGRGVPQDYVEAVRWYRLAVDQGFAAAQYNLGFMYDRGRGVPLDYVEALKWVTLATARASSDRQESYAAARDALAKLMTPAQIAAARTRAVEWQAAFDARRE
ncbi:MAG: tetratricopeptide repeat protein [Gemmatimonadetes bacterium]|nr:tetratricopeptide repeat protein [Gemmatimonadota bacterium]